MSLSSDIQSAAARLQKMPDRSANAPPVVHRDARLSELALTPEQPYLLIVGDAGHIIGIVPAREVRRRLMSANAIERSRWEAMPVGALLSMSLPQPVSSLAGWSSDSLDCSAIVEDGNLFGLACEGDLFLSWRRLESLLTEALSDPLTGLMNRLAYDRRLQEEWSRSARTGNSIGIVVVDLDDFKLINDTHGHVVGDEVLTQVGRQLELSMRSYDVVARFGGDEFVALCLGCAPGDIEIPVQRLLTSLQDIRMPVGDSHVTVTASVGAAVRHTGFANSQAEDLFVAADRCLYESKRSNASSWKVEFGCQSTSAPEPLVWRSGDDPEKAFASAL